MSDFKDSSHVEEQQNSIEEQQNELNSDEVVEEIEEIEEVVSDETSTDSSQVSVVEELQAKLLRVQADYDNFRRRTVKEKEELAKYASLKLIEQLVPTVDNFDRALEASSATKDYESFSKGIDMIFRSLMQVLENEGLQAINPVGEPFNPEYHQAIMTIETDDYEEGIVVEQLQKGYKIKDRVIRPAMVKVSS